MEYRRGRAGGAGGSGWWPDRSGVRGRGGFAGARGRRYGEAGMKRWRGDRGRVEPGAHRLGPGLPEGGIGWRRPGRRRTDWPEHTTAEEAALGLEWRNEYAAYPPFGRRRTDPGYGLAPVRRPYGADYHGPPRGMRPGAGDEYGGYGRSYEPGFRPTRPR